MTRGRSRTLSAAISPGEGRFADSAAILKPIRNECRYYRAKLQDILNTYRKIAGWDEFACRCVVLSCLTCTGYGTSASFPTNVNQKENIDAFVDALIALGLPVRDCITVLAAMYENWYQESAKQQIVEAVQEHFVTLEGLDALADAALNGSAPTRVMAVNGLDALASRPERAQEGRKALIACAGDSVQAGAGAAEADLSRPPGLGAGLSRPAQKQEGRPEKSCYTDPGGDRRGAVPFRPPGGSVRRKEFQAH